MSRLEQRISQTANELRILTDRRHQVNDRMRKRWKNKFVIVDVRELFIHTQITQLGLKELEKYDVEYLTEPDPKECFYSGTAYEPHNIFCCVCGSGNIWNTVALGFAPRFAACAKHNDFLFVAVHLRRQSSV